MKRLFFGLLMLGAISQLLGQEAPVFVPHNFYHHGQQLKFQLLSPPEIEPGKSYPLVLFLHGAGARGDDNQRPTTHIRPLFTAENLEKYPCYVLVPQCPEAYRWVETDWTLAAHQQPEDPSVPMQLVMALLNYTQQSYAVDTQRIYLTGLSMGGFGTWDLLARQPSRFAAAAPICGGGDPTTAPRIKDIPIWCFHGDQDPVVQVQRSRDMVKALKALQAPIRYTEYRGIGHGSWKPAYAEPEFLEWLFAQRRED